ncbi:hypothetical protein [Vibrio sp. SCSIO 43137]|uniref:hypothetical protein n=1 Tax=Vibrio sp. SCSIO 43137 TaxID=3021011 RepID=UPI0023073B4E|nr:hypothetical protein [Vibrio sp. SCSIO 43137]WCE31123.1 hypothetical protein PK654_07615 [Vibrio sp. SCSIO 43137]
MFINEKKDQFRTLVIEVLASSPSWLAGEWSESAIGALTQKLDHMENFPNYYGLNSFLWESCDFLNMKEASQIKNELLNTLKCIYIRLGGELSIYNCLTIESKTIEFLSMIDLLAINNNSRIAVFINEFHLLAQCENGVKLEWEIRNALQHSERVSFIFSGNNAELLKSRFIYRDCAFFGMCRPVFNKN